MAAFTLSAEIIEQVQAAAKLQAPTGNYDYIIVAGYTPDTTYIAVGASGTLSVYYEYDNAPAQSIFIGRPWGGTESVKAGANTFEVNTGDMLVCSATNVIKLGLGFSKSPSS